MQKNSERGREFLHFILIALSILALIWSALANGYPLLFSDSATYLISGHMNFTPIDRPIIYGKFVEYASLYWSIWPVIIMQSAIINYFIYLICRFLLRAKQPVVLQCIFVITLSLVSSIDYYCSFISPDIFTAVCILGPFLALVVDGKYILHHRILIGFFTAVAMTSHLSHLLIIVFQIGLLFILHWISSTFRSIYSLRNLFLMGAFTILSLLALATINYSKKAGFQLSRAKNVVLTARLIESGLVEKYLNKHCTKADFNADYRYLCDYLGEFDKWPAAGFFLWRQDSPLYANNCNSGDFKACWLEKDPIYGQLIEDMSKDAAIRTAFVKTAISGSLQQLLSFKQYQIEPGNCESEINHFYPGDMATYSKAKQTQSAVDFDQSNLIEAIVVVLSLIILIYFLIYQWKSFSRGLKLLFWMILPVMIFNAAICATLSNVVPRYQGRIIFLLPLLVLIASTQLIQQRKRLPKIDVYTFL